jgi:hypothetical protein
MSSVSTAEPECFRWTDRANNGPAGFAIEQKAVQMGGLDEYQFICECSAADCFERISLTLRDYEDIRREGVRFVVTPGHEDVEVELVVGTTGMYSIVEKDGSAGVVAEFADPRDGEPGHG